MYNEHVVARHLFHVQLLTDIKENYVTGKYTMSESCALGRFVELIDNANAEMTVRMAQEMGLWEPELAIFA